MNKVTFNGFNDNVNKVASKVVDLCASIEDVMYEVVKGIEISDGVYPVYIDAEAKKNTMLAIKELNHLVSIMVSNDDVPSRYIDTDIVLNDFVNSVYGSINKADVTKKRILNGAYGITASMDKADVIKKNIENGTSVPIDDTGRSEYREKLNKWMNDD